MPLSGAPEGHLSVDPNRYPKVCEPQRIRPVASSTGDVEPLDKQHRCETRLLTIIALAPAVTCC